MFCKSLILVVWTSDWSPCITQKCSHLVFKMTAHLVMLHPLHQKKPLRFRQVKWLAENTPHKQKGILCDCQVQPCCCPVPPTPNCCHNCLFNKILNFSRWLFMFVAYSVSLGTALLPSSKGHVFLLWGVLWSLLTSFLFHWSSWLPAPFLLFLLFFFLIEAFTIGTIVTTSVSLYCSEDSMS